MTTAIIDTLLLFTFFLTLFDLSNSCYNSSFRCIEENWADALICPLGLLLKMLWHRSLLVIRWRNSGIIQSCLGESPRELRITFRVSQGHCAHYCLWLYPIEWSAIISSLLPLKKPLATSFSGPLSPPIATILTKPLCNSSIVAIIPSKVPYWKEPWYSSQRWLTFLVQSSLVLSAEIAVLIGLIRRSSFH